MATRRPPYRQQPKDRNEGASQSRAHRHQIRDLPLRAERLQLELTDRFELQKVVTGGIAASLHLQLARVESRRNVAERTTDPNAYDMR